MGFLLEESEIEKLTGSRRPREQARWLRDHRWKFTINSKGKINVARGEYGRLRAKQGLPVLPVPGYQAPGQLLSIEELRALPRRIEYRSGGVYFLWNGDELLYIGRTFMFGQRIAGHEFKGEIPFSSCSVVVCSEPLSREDLEQAYIRAYRPPFNRRIS